MPITTIKCIIVDQPHNTFAKEVNKRVIRKIHSVNSDIRIVALSSAIGATDQSVMQIIHELMISELKFYRSESLAESEFHKKCIKRFIDVALDENIETFRKDFLGWKDDYLNNLARLLGKPELGKDNYSGEQIYAILNKLRSSREKSKRDETEETIWKELHVLLNASTILERSGLRELDRFLTHNSAEEGNNCGHRLKQLMQEKAVFEGKGSDYGHPKFTMLGDLLIEYNINLDGATSKKAIVFAQTDGVVKDIDEYLYERCSGISPLVFTSLDSLQGLKNGMKSVKESTCNVLISKSLGQNGHLIGEVDLVIIFDSFAKTPTTELVQRMNLTGKSRDGCVIFLQTGAEETATIKKALEKADMQNIEKVATRVKWTLCTSPTKLFK